MKFSDSMSIQKGSGYSFASKATFRMDDEYFEDLSYEELQVTEEETMQMNKTLQLENDMFERFLMRNDPDALQKLSQIIDSARTSQKINYQMKPMSAAPSLSGSIITTSFSLKEPLSPSNASVRTYGSHRYSASAVGQMRGFKITMEQRIAMTIKEIEIMQRNLHQFQKSGTTQKATFRAKVEEVQLRILETNESRERFEVDVVNGIDPHTGSITAEKFKRFIDSWMKITQSVIDRIRLKTCTIKSQIRKAKQQLTEREDFSENLQLIDFEQVQIENQNLIQSVNDKNQSLLEMKKITGHYNLRLTTHKQILNERIGVINSVKHDIFARYKETQKLRNEQVVTKIQVKNAENKLQKIMNLLNIYEVPSIMSLIDIQQKHQEAKQRLKRLQTHRNIQKFAVKPRKPLQVRNSMDEFL